MCHRVLSEFMTGVQAGVTGDSSREDLEWSPPQIMIVGHIYNVAFLLQALETCMF